MRSFHIDRLLETVVRAKATDAQLVAGLPPRLRIEGEERPLQTKPLSAKHVSRLFESIAPDRNAQELESRGRTVFAFSFGKKGRFRVSASRCHGGIALTLRFLPAEPPTFDELGLPSIFKSLLRRPRGLLLVVGPRAAGKTTVTAGLLEHINLGYPYRITTIEQPIEFVHASKVATVVQREVGTHVEGAAEAIDSLSADNTDVAMVADLRDEAVVRASLECVMMDCLVLAQMPARGVFHAITRLCSIRHPCGPDYMRRAVSSSVVAVIVRNLCRRIDGGMVPAYELMVTTPAISALIRDDQLHRLDAAILTGRKYSMQLLDDQLFDLFRAGVISADEALNKSRSPEQMQTRISGQSDDDDGPLTSQFPVKPDPPPPGLSESAEPGD